MNINQVSGTCYVIYPDDYAGQLAIVKPVNTDTWVVLNVDGEIKMRDEFLKCLTYAYNSLATRCEAPEKVPFTPAMREGFGATGVMLHRLNIK